MWTNIGCRKFEKAKIPICAYYPNQLPAVEEFCAYICAKF